MVGALAVAIVMTRAWERNLRSWEQNITDEQNQPNEESDDEAPFDYDSVLSAHALTEFGNMRLDLKAFTHTTCENRMRVKLLGFQGWLGRYS